MKIVPGEAKRKAQFWALHPLGTPLFLGFGPPTLRGPTLRSRTLGDPAFEAPNFFQVLGLIEKRGSH